MTPNRKTAAPTAVEVSAPVLDCVRLDAVAAVLQITVTEAKRLVSHLFANPTAVNAESPVPIAGLCERLNCSDYVFRSVQSGADSFIGVEVFAQILQVTVATVQQRLRQYHDYRPAVFCRPLMRWTRSQARVLASQQQRLESSERSRAAPGISWA